MLTVNRYLTLLMVDHVITVNFEAYEAVSFDTIMINLENVSLSTILHLKKAVEVFHSYGNPTNLCSERSIGINHDYVLGIKSVKARVGVIP